VPGKRQVTVDERDAGAVAGQELFIEECSEILTVATLQIFVNDYFYRA
jgi:hypothetical protein